MPHVMERDRQAYAHWAQRAEREAPKDPAFVHEAHWADFLADRISWMDISEAPRDGTMIEVLYDDGTSEEDVYWATTRQCMLGPRAGERGPGWVSSDAGHLPVGDGPRITHYRDQR